MASYYDKILEDFDTRESAYDEGIYDEGLLDEGILDEARRRPVRMPPSLGRPANFGRNVGAGAASNAQGNLVTKAELRSSLNSISDQVNDLKKSGLTLAASLKRLDDGYERVVKTIARKDRTQDSLMSSNTMTGLLGTLVNKPRLNTAALTIHKADTTHPNDFIEIAPGQDPIQVDLVKTLLFTLLPGMMSGGSSGGDNMMMMLPLVLLLGQPQSGTGAASATTDNTNLIMVMMMASMMNKK